MYEVIIIGSGFGGQCAAINLLKQGISNFILLERRSFMGGTWVQNRYPGAAVDVQSPLYSLSFEPYAWSRMFAEQQELEDYTNHVIEKYQLEEKTHTQTNVTKIKWNETSNTWHIKTETGKSYQARFIINASGPLSTPVIPNFKGKNEFNGVQFHTNHWDKTFDYCNKRVAVIGSGASAIQVIPAIANKVKHLYVFQRTPHWVMPRHDKVFSKFMQSALKLKPFYNLIRWFIYWSLETRIIAFKYSKLAIKYFATNKALKHLNNQIKNKTLREQLTPNYTIGCKRILLSNTFYPTLEKENVTLLTKKDAIAEITTTGIRTTSGKNIALDAIVYATGFDATDGVISYPVIGKDRIKLSDYWSDFPRAYLGTTVPSFPNLFFVTGPNTGIGHTSAIFMIEAQMKYIMDCIAQVKKRNKTSIAVKPEVEAAYTNKIHKVLDKTVWVYGGCNSWYQSKSGKVVAMFPGFSFSFRFLCRKMNFKHHNIT